MFRHATRSNTCILFCLTISLIQACDKKASEPSVRPDNSKLQVATDVFWALQNLGFMVVKENPVSTKHGCKPFEYLAQKGPSDAMESRFRISVFECQSTQQAQKIVQNDYTRKVDSLLRNHHEGGVIRRQAMEIIIRKEKGTDKASDELIKAIEGM